MTQAMDPATQFRAALAEHQDRIYRICTAYVRDPADRDDVYQAILIHLWESLGTFDGRSSLGTWVCRVAVNTCLHHLRTEARRLRMEVAAAREPIPPGLADAPQSADTSSQPDPVQRLYACIQALPPLDRLLVALHLQDASTAQIADVLGISAANVRIKLHRARKSLKAIWERNEDGDR